MDWTKTKISSFLKERSDRFKPEEANEMGLQRLEKIDFSGKICLNANKPTQTGMILVKKGDLVISGINVEKGAVAVYQGDEDILATIHYSSYQFDEKKIDVEFFKWFLKSAAFEEALSTQIKGGIKTELKPKRFLPLEIYLPDVKTQKEISKKLNAVKDEINETSDIQYKNEQLVDKLRQQILSEAVSGKLVPQNSKDEPASELLKKIKKEKEINYKRNKESQQIKEEETPYLLPKGWIWVRLTDLISILGDGIHGTPNYSIDGDYFFVNGNNLVDGKIIIKENTKRVSLEEYKKYKKELNERTIFVSINGTIGNLAFYNDEKIILGKSACYFNLLSDINKYYIKLLLNTNYFLDYAINSSTGTTIKNVSLESMRSFLVPLPPFTEQMRIVEKVNSLTKICDELEKNIIENQKNADNLMGAVLKEAFENEA